MRYILLVVALLGACDVTNNGCHLGHHLGFYQELEVRLKPSGFFFVLDINHSTQISTLHYFIHKIFFHCWKKFNKKNYLYYHSKWLDHLLLMTSHLVTLETEHVYIIIFADQVFIDPTFFGIFVCGPLQSLVVHVCTKLLCQIDIVYFS